MKQNRLQLNADKTELIWIGPKQSLSKVNINTIQLWEFDIKVSISARNLGVVFDSQMTLGPHVSNVVRSCFYQLRQIRTIHSSLTKDAAKTLVIAFVCSILDYCNSLNSGLSVHMQTRLQSVFNAAARLVSGRHKFDHITDVLRDLHWLRVPQRCQYKLASITRSCLQGRGPSYLSESLTLVSSTSNMSHLRSAKHQDLLVPRSRTKRYSRIFAISGPATWNSLPTEIRNLPFSDKSFASKLKTHLFTLSYN